MEQILHEWEEAMMLYDILPLDLDDLYSIHSPLLSGAFRSIKNILRSKWRMSSTVGSACDC